MPEGTAKACEKECARKSCQSVPEGAGRAERADLTERAGRSCQSVPERAELTECCQSVPKRADKVPEGAAKRSVPEGAARACRKELAEHGRRSWQTLPERAAGRACQKEER